MGRSRDEDAPNGLQRQAGMQDRDGWSYTNQDDYKNAKLPAVEDELGHQGGNLRSEAGNRHDDVAVLANKVKGIEQAILQMESTMTCLAEGQAASHASARHEESSVDEVAPCPQGGGKASRHSPRARDKAQDSGRHYYAVARGRSPGVYTDWGSAEKQVNGFSGALQEQVQGSQRGSTLRGSPPCQTGPRLRG
jgi:Caulimovirus viroplasmin